MKTEIYLTTSEKEALLDKAVPIPVTGCMIWMGAVANKYPVINLGPRGKSDMRGVHRLMCNCPPHLEAMHSCDVTFCIAPWHLTPGTRQENIDDRGKKGRTLKGEGVGNSKLTKDQVKQIRAASGTQRSIADRFGIGQATVSLIKRGLLWGHLND